VSVVTISVMPNTVTISPAMIHTAFISTAATSDVPKPRATIP
jgi:hypothetical protein